MLPPIKKFGILPTEVSSSWSEGDWSWVSEETKFGLFPIEELIRWERNQD